jgi:hypothetical protein
MELSEFYNELFDDLEESRVLTGYTFTEEFFNYAIDMLSDADEVIGDAHYMYYEQQVSGAGGRQRAQIHGYSFNETDGILTLYTIPEINMEETTSLDKATAESAFKRAWNFFSKADEVVHGGEESNEAVDLAYNITQRDSKDAEFHDLQGVKIAIITEKKHVASLDVIESQQVDNLKITYQIYDLPIFEKLAESRGGKLDLVLNFFDGEIQGVQANDASDYASYLCSINGLKLAELYNDHGSRLIEGNVRSFLQTRGKVNKGIRETILKNPEMFFAYNNGLTATCTDLDFENGMVHQITNLQIVNGGQTTASLANVLTNDKAADKLQDVYVPMKLNIIKNEAITDDLIADISRYANSQNKVSEVDLASNHPFHRRVEEFSRHVVTPLLDGYSYGTHWYYERAAGQYAQETYKKTKTEKKNFEKLNPKSQMFKKSDFAKYHNIISKKPHIASKGGQTAFTAFTKWIIETWDKNDSVIDEAYFKDQVANIIIFKQVDKVVKEAYWYNSYKANIVAYSMSYLYWWLDEHGKQVNFYKIWNEQKVDAELIGLFAKLTFEVNNFLQDENRPVANVTEWAKRELCWTQLKKLDLIPTYYNFGTTVVDKDSVRQADVIKWKDTVPGEIEHLSPGFLEQVYELMLHENLFTSDQVELVKRAVEKKTVVFSNEEVQFFNDLVDIYFYDLFESLRNRMVGRRFR